MPLSVVLAKLGVDTGSGLTGGPAPAAEQQVELARAALKSYTSPLASATIKGLATHVRERLVQRVELSVADSEALVAAAAKVLAPSTPAAPKKKD